MLVDLGAVLVAAYWLTVIGGERAMLDHHLRYAAPEDIGRSWTKSAAFEIFAAVYSNNRWSWSGHTPDDSSVTLTFWSDHFDFSGPRVLYDDTGWTDPTVERRHGNIERKSNIELATRKLDGRVNVVWAHAADPDASPRSGKGWLPLRHLKMRVTDFDQLTGEWRAESI